MAWREFAKFTDRWNRLLHTYIGLYLLLFIWLFAFTGLLLNHPQWEFSQFWAEREQSSVQQDIVISAQGNDQERARELMRQLDVTGEIDHIEPSPEEGRFDVRVVKPGEIIDVRADLGVGHATVERIQVNAWGVMHMLHSFTGVRMDGPGKTRDWAMTKLWSLFMDGVSFGLIALVVSGLCMWYQRHRNRRLGLFFLALGSVSCGLFALGLLP